MRDGLDVLVENSLEMAGELTVSGVVNLFSGVEIVGNVEFVKLIVGQFNVVLDSIAIGVVDLVAAFAPSGLEKADIIRDQLEVLGRFNLVREGGDLSLDIFSIVLIFSSSVL